MFENGKGSFTRSQHTDQFDGINLLRGLSYGDLAGIRLGDRGLRRRFGRFDRFRRRRGVGAEDVASAGRCRSSPQRKMKLRHTDRRCVPRHGFRKLCLGGQADPVEIGREERHKQNAV